MWLCDVSKFNYRNVFSYEIPRAGLNIYDSFNEVKVEFVFFD